MSTKKTANDLGDLFRRTLALTIALILLAGTLPARAETAEETEYIVKFKASELRDTEDESAPPFEVVSKEEMERLRDEDLLEWYAENSRAALIDPEPRPLLTGTRSAYYGGSQWNLDMIGAETAYLMGFLGQGVRVGVIDSGVAPHPDLVNNLVGGKNYISKASDPNDIGDNVGHGTEVAGFVAASENGAYIGVAPCAELVSLKVTDTSDNIAISDICDAIYGGINEYHCDVLNLSLGLPDDNPALREAIAYAAKKNVVVVASVGNNSGTELSYPAAYDTVIGVGSVNKYGKYSYFTRRNESVFLTAPGENVRSTDNRNGYDENLYGTSYSAPQAAGAAAVLLGAAPALTPAEIMDILARTAADAGDAGYDTRYGYGILSLSGCAAVLADLLEDGSPCAFYPVSGAAKVIRNNTGEPLACVYLMAEYEESGALREVKTAALTIPPHEIADIEVPSGEYPFGQFVCEAETMAPLIAARKSA